MYDHVGVPPKCQVLLSQFPSPMRSHNSISMYSLCYIEGYNLTSKDEG